MSVVINTNSAASIAASNLENSSEMLKKSLNRLSSGSKIVTGADDAGGVAVAARLSAGSRRSAAANTGIGNAISFLQNQDSVLKELSKIVTRMNELETMYKDATTSTDDKALYTKEYNGLKSTYTDMLASAYNGTKLVVKSVTADPDANPPVEGVVGADLTVTVDETGTTKKLGGATFVDLALASTMTISGGGSAAALDKISSSRAQNGADQSSLGYYAALGQARVNNYDAAVSRIMDVDVAAESTQLARWTTLVQAGTAMLAQANGSTVSGISLLKG